MSRESMSAESYWQQTVRQQDPPSFAAIADWHANGLADVYIGTYSCLAPLVLQSMIKLENGLGSCKWHLR